MKNITNKTLKLLQIFAKPKKSNVEKQDVVKTFLSKITGKDKKLENFYKALKDTRDAIDENNISKAKRLYSGARYFYISLRYDEKRRVYHELMDLYTELSK